MYSQATKLAMRNPIAPLAALAAASLVLLGAGCGGAVTKTGSADPTATASRSSAPAWRRGTTPPKVTAALIAQAGYGLTLTNANLGTVDQALASAATGAHVSPSAKRLNDEYARFGRCMGEQLKIHDLGHELALLAAYNRKSRSAQAAVGNASLVCYGSAITPDASYRQSLVTNP
jgi:hypothetical protein